jgi:hypothetical protein
MALEIVALAQVGRDIAKNNSGAAPGSSRGNRHFFSSPFSS